MATKFQVIKTYLIAYFLLLQFGFLGVHRMYLGRVKSGFLMLGLFIVSFFLLTVREPYFNLPSGSILDVLVILGPSIILIFLFTRWLGDFFALPKLIAVKLDKESLREK